MLYHLPKTGGRFIDCYDAYLEAFGDEGWVISNKDKR